MHPDHPHACANCATPLQGDYCHACGQHAHSPVRSFAHAVEEVFESFWHLDGRIFRTLRRLLAPGRLAQDYLEGRRAPYVAPMRLFVILCVLTFFVGRAVVHFGGDGTGGIEVQAVDPALARATTVAEVERVRREQTIELVRARDSLPPALAPARAGFDRSIAELHAQADARVRALGGTPAPSTLQVASPQAPPSGWVEAVGRRMERNIARLREDPELLKHAFLGSVPTALFVLVPVLALLLRLAYIGSGRLYLEHLVVALYSHAFLCLALLGQMGLAVLARWSDAHVPWAGAGLVVPALLLWLWMPGYLLLMQKRVYAERWPLTVVKFTLVGGLYALMLGVAALGLLLVSLARL